MSYAPDGANGDGWHSLGSTILGSTALAFDPAVDLLWSGDANGTVASYFPDSLHRYTSCKAHQPAYGPVKELFADEKGIFSLGHDALHCTNRNGTGSWTYHSQEKDLTAASFINARASDLVVSSAQGHLTTVNASTGSPLKQIQDSSQSIAHLTHTAHHLVSGSSQGTIAIRDPRSLETQHTVHGHAGGLLGLEGSGHQLLSFGYTLVQGRPVLEPIVQVWDIRSLRPLMPINLPGGPVALQIHPRLSGTIIVVNQAAQMQVVNTADTSRMAYHQIETNGYITCSAMASTGEALAFGDSNGLMHLWSSSPDPEPHFSRRSQTIDLPDPPEPLRRVEWNDHTPLNLIGMPHYTSSLLSNIPYEHWVTKHSPLFRPRPPLDPVVLQNLQRADFVGYARNPGHVVRNQVATAAQRQDRRKLDVPSFKSQKQRQRIAQGALAKEDDQEQQEEEQQEKDAADDLIKWYRKLEIKYSRFGIDDFDFGFYNKTPHAGLETHVSNAYINSLVQLFSATAPLSRLAQAHTAQDCPKESCLLCELGFLTKMLHDAHGANCQASNFSRAFASNPKAVAAGLMDMEENASKASYSTLIQAANQFFISEMSSEALLTPSTESLPGQSLGADGSGSAIEDLFGLRLRTSTTCSSCGSSATRDSKKLLIDLLYPPKALSNETRPPSDFYSILRASIVRGNISKTLCSACRRATHIKVRRQLSTEGGNSALPALLSINAGVRTALHLDLWQDGPAPEQHFLPNSFALSATNTDVQVLPQARDQSHVTYQLRGMVLQIQVEGEPAHLVALVNMQNAPDQAPAWHLFNDFLVRPVSPVEVFSFAGSWKIPAVLLYARANTPQALDLSKLPSQADARLLCRDISLSPVRDPERVAHSLFKEEELPQPGDLVAIDAEFVSLQQEEVEVHSDGQRKLIRPAKLSLARVSVLRGQGPLSGTPFIDDHIHTSHPIADYLTEFSGIMPGDLDASKSPHTLVPLKTAYKKLRILVDRGCVFVGHGLASDFRIINIYVPPEQILDTVSIYYLPERQRKLSLRFLAWTVLTQHVQSAGTHDSIEDARTALQLYQEYQRMLEDGTWSDDLEDIFREGKRLNWKVPGLSPLPPAGVLPVEVQASTVPEDR